MCQCPWNTILTNESLFYQLYFRLLEKCSLLELLLRVVPALCLRGRHWLTFVTSRLPKMGSTGPHKSARRTKELSALQRELLLKRLRKAAISNDLPLDAKESWINIYVFTFIIVIVQNKKQKCLTWLGEHQFLGDADYFSTSTESWKCTPLKLISQCLKKKKNGCVIFKKKQTHSLGIAQSNSAQPYIFYSDPTLLPHF